MPRFPAVRSAIIGLIFMAGVALAFAAKPLQPAAVGEALAVAGGSRVDVHASAANSVAGNSVQFDTLALPLAPNVVSVGFAAAAAAEIGDLVQLDGTHHAIDAVVVTLSSRALRSDFPGAPAAGFNHPVTLRLYAVDRSTGTPRAGALLATLTSTFAMPWRPEPDSSAAPSALRPWRAADGRLYPGIAFTVTFDLGALTLSLPSEVIYGIACDTAFSGHTPLGVAGPYDFVELGFTERAPVAGTDLEADAIFWKTSRASNYTDLGFSAVNTFRRDTGWSPYHPAVRLTSSTYAALASAVADLGFLRTADRAAQAALTESIALGTWALTKTLWDGTTRVRPVMGRLVFDLLAEAAGELTELAQSRGSLASGTQDAIDAFLAAAEALAEVAIADAVVAGGDARRIGRAQDAFDGAVLEEARQRFEQAIEEFGTAWRAATLSVR